MIIILQAVVTKLIINIVFTYFDKTGGKCLQTEYSDSSFMMLFREDGEDRVQTRVRSKWSVRED